MPTTQTTPRLHLTASPIICVLGQVRFSSILSMEKFVPAIQEKLRGSNFPKFTKSIVQAFQFGSKEVETVVKWDFISKNGKSAITLTNDFVSYYTSDYLNFENFLETFLQIFVAINQEAQINLVERIGLRYVNLINYKSEGKGLENYLKPNLLGPSDADLKVSNSLIRFEKVGDTSLGELKGTLVVRCFQTNDGSFLPPDLGIEKLIFNIEPKAGDQNTLLDIDHFSKETWDCDVEMIRNNLWELHDKIEMAFLSAVTPQALERWGAKELENVTKS